MSPVSKKRKRKSSAPPVQRSSRPNRAEAKTRGNVTPSVSQICPVDNGFKPSAEAVLMERHCQVWQAMTEGQWAGTCIGAAIAVIPALRDYGIHAVPLVVHGEAMWRNGFQSPLGRPDAGWAANGRWRGHMVLYVPALRKMFDPTVYQVNRRDAPTTITRALLVTLPDLQTLAAGEVHVPKDGAIIRYELNSVQDGDAVIERAQRGVPKQRTEDMIAVLREAVDTHLRSESERAWLREATYPPLVEALRAKGLLAPAAAPAQDRSTGEVDRPASMPTDGHSRQRFGWLLGRRAGGATP